MGSKRAFRYGVIVELLLFWSSLPLANANDIAIGSFPPNFVRLGLARANVWAHDCGSADCQAISAIFFVQRLILEAHATDMSSAAIGAARRAEVAREISPSRVNRRLNQLLLAQSDRFAAVCKRLRNLASSYEQDGPNAADGTLVLQLIEIAQLVDTKTHGHCLPDMLAPLPHSPKMADIIVFAHGDCVNSQWHNPDCSRIRQLWLGK